ncbi:MAG: clostripain-related cysteine peptidase [Halobacteriovoraceae bacterium]|nr:clostripain-related cysteine peptidase [Halobacteriovoraceae bacterium]
MQRFKVILILSILHLIPFSGTKAKDSIVSEYPSWYPKVECSKKWKGLKEEGKEKYSFEKDAMVTDLGNVGYSDYAKRVEREKCIKDWTVLVYMAADNDLSPYSLWDIHEMETRIKDELNLGASTDATDVLVELDTLRDTGVRRLHIFQSEENYRSDLGLEEYERMDERFIRSPIVKWFPEADKPGRLTSAEQRFKRFLSWGVQKYPSKKYMIVIWGHGEGFLGKFHEAKNITNNREYNYLPLTKKSEFFSAEDFILEPFKNLPKPKSFSLNKAFGGIGFDYSDNSFIDISTLGEILDGWKQKLLEGRNFDLLAFDACLMQSLEVITEVGRSTNYIAGSNQIQNYLGLPYRKLLDKINQGVSGFDLARELPKLTEASWGKDGYQGSVDPKGYETFTMSTMASGQIEENLYFHLHKTSVQLLTYFNEDDRRKTEFLFLLEQAPRFQGEMIDMGMFYGLLEKLLYEEREGQRDTARSEMLRQTVSEARFRLREVFIDSKFGPLYFDSTVESTKGYLLGFFNGLSLWLPKSERLYLQRKEEMAKSSLHKSVTSWNLLLQELYKVELFDLGQL